MKKYFVIASVLCMFAFGCTLSKMIKLSQQQQLTLVPSPLELHGNKVESQVSATLPPGILPKGKLYRLDHFYVYGTEEVQLESQEFLGDDYPNSKASTTQRSYAVGWDYTPDHQRGELHTQAIAVNPANGKFKTAERVPLGIGVITTSELAQSIYTTSYAFHGYNDQEEWVPTDVDFFFLQGSSVLRSTEIRGDESQRLNAFLANQNVLRKITIVGHHSPEGTETINTSLAQRRAEVVEKYYRERLDKYDYENVADSIQFELKPVVRDYTEFKKMLREFDVDENVRGQMMGVVNGGGTFEDKELALRDIDGYKRVYKDLYPKLRTSRTTTQSVKFKLPNAQIAVLAKKIAMDSIPADSLSHEELLFGATLTPLLEERIQIYKAAAAAHGSFEAHNNLAAALLAHASIIGDEEQCKLLIAEASKHLEIAAKSTPNTAEVSANLGVAYLLQGNVERAYASISEAANLNPRPETAQRIHAVKGAIQVKQGQYQEAIMSFENAGDHVQVAYDRGLALLLSKQFDLAKIAFEKVIEQNPKYALAHYSLAIVHARVGNESEILPLLKGAVSVDPSLKERAISDLEFRDYASLIAQL